MMNELVDMFLLTAPEQQDIFDLFATRALPWIEDCSFEGPRWYRFNVMGGVVIGPAMFNEREEFDQIAIKQGYQLMGEL